MSISVRQPDCVRTTLTNQSGQVSADCYFFRALVVNRGKRRAVDVELYAEKLERQEGGKFTPVAQFPPMDFKWSHVGKPLQSISPGLKKHCDIGYVAQPIATDLRTALDQIFNPTVQFSFVLEVNANQGGWQIEAGTYRLHVALAAANAKVQRRVLEITFAGQWMDDEIEMFSQGIQVKITRP